MIDKYINHIKGIVKFDGVDPDELEIMVKDDKMIFLYESHFSLISLSLLNFLGKEGMKFDFVLGADYQEDFAKDKINSIQITVDIGELSKMNEYLIDFKDLD